MAGIVILEGADASGKTTLARYLVERHGARYLHLGPYRDVWRWHLGAYLRAQRLAAAGELVVVDRHWISECFYGEVYRGGSAYPVTARCFDRLWLRSAAITVLCAPSDPRRQECDHFARDLEAKGNAYSSDRKRPVQRIIARYYDLARGNLAQPGDDYASQAIRFGDFAGRADVRVYDRFREGDNLAQVARDVLSRLWVWRDYQLPIALDPDHPNFGGHLAAARWGLCGQEVSAAIAKRADLAFPFVDREDHASAAWWLNRSLHELRLSEFDLVTVNARPSVELRAAVLARPDLPWVALGREAEAALVEAGAADVRAIPHPQWARRFDHRGDYAAQLREALQCP